MTRISVTSSAENEISNNDKEISRPPPRTSTNTITSTAGTRSYEDHDHYDNDDDDVSDVGNDDPIDNYKYDDGDGNDDNDDEEGPRFKYSTVDLANGGCRNSKYCLIAMGVFFIVIAIAVSICLLYTSPSPRDSR